MAVAFSDFSNGSLNDGMSMISKPPESLVALYDVMCEAVEACRDVGLVKEMRDQARALEVYAAEAFNTEAARKAAEIRIRAERRAGELLKEAKASGQRDSGGRGRIESRGLTQSPPQLSDLGITKDQSSKWQQLADVPLEYFEAALNVKAKPSTQKIINAYQSLDISMPQRVELTAWWFWRRLRDFEEKKVFDRHFFEMFDVMERGMQEDCIRILPTLLHWLERI